MVFLPRFYYTLVIAILLALASTWAPDGLMTSLVLTLLLTCAVLVDVVDSGVLELARLSVDLQEHLRDAG